MPVVDLDTLTRGIYRVEVSWGRGIVRRQNAEVQVGSPIVALDNSPRLVSDSRSDSMISMAEAYLRNRAEKLKRNIGPELHIQAEKLVALICQLDRRVAQRFFENPHVVERLEDYLNLDPTKISLAITIANKMERLAQAKGYDPEFIPVLNLVCFSMIELIRDSSYAKSMTFMLSEDMRRKLRKEELNRSSSNRPKRSRLRHLANYLDTLCEDLQGSTLSGSELENALIEIIADDVYKRLQKTTQQIKRLNQPQGVEVEVLTRIEQNEIEKAIRAGLTANVDNLPRGIKQEDHIRKDWYLLPLMGIKEDVGERKYQVFEASPYPTFAGATQSTLIWAMMATGFIDSRFVSNDEETYSLHVSTIFPQAIINTKSLDEYRRFAQVLGAGFASTQRMALGGFMQGGKEIADKTKSGNKRGIFSFTRNRNHYYERDMALIEIRSLDITPLNQHRAIMYKQYLDFGFRCAWEEKINPGRRFSPMEKTAARVWNEFMADQEKLFAKYGLTKDSVNPVLQGKVWDNRLHAEVAKLRRSNPAFQQDMINIVRRAALKIKSASDQEIEGQRATSVRRIMREPLGRDDRRLLYIDELERNRLGLKLEEKVVMRYGDKKVEVVVVPAYLRGDGKIEGSASIWRTTEAVLTELGIKDGVSISPRFSFSRRELAIDMAESEDPAILKMREPRYIKGEPKSEFKDSIYMNQQDREKLGLKPGDEIWICFGTFKRKVQVRQAYLHEGKVDRSSWRLSNNLIREIGIPEDYNLRAKYDSDRRELIFGPTIALLHKIEMIDGKPSIVGWNQFVKQISHQGRNMGVFVCFVDPDKQQPEAIDQGLVDAYIPQPDGTLQQKRIPIPEVIYDKNIYHQDKKKKLKIENQARHKIVPHSIQEITSDKSTFAEMLRKSILSEYHPDTTLLCEETLDQFLAKYNSLILKPRWGQRAQGIISIDRISTSFGSQAYRVFYAKEVTTADGTKQWVSFERTCSSTQEILNFTKELRGGSTYLVQEKIPLAKYRIKDGVNEYIRTPEIRVIIQRGIDGIPRITGMVTRLPDPKLIGHEYTMDPRKVVERMFPGQETNILEKVRVLGILTAELIERLAQEYIGEIAVDIGLQTDGKPMIIEANSKPETMGMFYETGNKDGVYHSSHRPLEYVLYLTNMD